MQVEHHSISERSWTMHLLQVLIRPFKPSLVKPPAQSKLEKQLEWSENGSPRFSVPKSVKRNCMVTEREIRGVWCYDLDYRQQRTSTEGKKSGRILYFCGGGFQAPPSSQHWSFIVELSRQVPHLHLTLISYPLAPRSTGSKAMPILSEVYEEISAESQRVGEDLYMCGDSSGGNIALSLTLHMLSLRSSQDITQASNSKIGTIIPKSLLLISPVVDLANDNPKMIEIDKVDPVMSKNYTGEVARKWRGKTPSSDPIVSPIEGDLSALRDNGVVVNGIVGTWDVLCPDTLTLLDKLKEVGVRGDWWVGEGQMHCFPLAWKYGLSDSKRAKDWIIDILKKNSSV